MEQCFIFLFADEKSKSLGESTENSKAPGNPYSWGFFFPTVGYYATLNKHGNLAD